MMAKVRTTTRERPPVLALLQHSWRSERLWLALSVLGGALAAVIVANIWPGDADSGIAGWWANGLDPVLAFATVLLAATLWLAGLNARWRASLEKRLTVHFAIAVRPGANQPYDYVYSCYDAYLAGEGDIRAWGQQIGLQMHGQQLDFYPYMTHSGPTLVGSDDGYHLQYEVTFYLRTGGKPGYTVWFENDDKTTQNKSVVLRERPSTPYTPEEAKLAEDRESTPVAPPSAPVAERLVNLTPHPLRLMVDDATVLEKDAGPPARVREVRSEARKVAGQFGIFPLMNVGYEDEITGLPAPEAGVLFVVSRLTAQAAPHRDDLVFPLDEVRNDKGDVVGCRALGRFRRPEAAARIEP